MSQMVCSRTAGWMVLNLAIECLIFGNGRRDRHIYTVGQDDDEVERLRLLRMLMMNLTWMW